MREQILLIKRKKERERKKLHRKRYKIINFKKNLNRITLKKSFHHQQNKQQKKK